jgi:hypothetical protein
VKTIRRLFIIYKFKLRTILLDRFLKWRLYIASQPTVRKDSNKDIVNSFSSLNIDRNDIYSARTENRTIDNRSVIQKRVYSPESHIGEANPLIIENVNSETLYSASPNNSVEVKKAEELMIIPKPALHERLFKERMIKEMKHNRLIQQFRDKETSECTFIPKTNNKPRPKSAIRIDDEEPPYVKLYHVSNQRLTR